MLLFGCCSTRVLFVRVHKLSGGCESMRDIERCVLTPRRLGVKFGLVPFGLGLVPEFSSVVLSFLSFINAEISGTNTKRLECRSQLRINLPESDRSIPSGFL